MNERMMGFPVLGIEWSCLELRVERRVERWCMFPTWHVEISQ